MTPEYFLFLVNLGLLFTHELDAVRRHEWRMFAGLNQLYDEWAYRIFVTFHIPIFILVGWLLRHPSETVTFWFQTVVDGFLVFHMVLHYFFRKHHKNEFDDPFSIGIIISMGGLGIVHLLLIVSVA